jgi:hypothetical protein
MTVYIQTFGMLHMHYTSNWLKALNSIFIASGLYNVVHTALANPGISIRIFENIHFKRFGFYKSSVDVDIETSRSNS